MSKRIPIIAALGVCALLAEYVISAENPAALLKQADTYRTNRQYDQAEQLYLALAGQNAPEAFAAQKNLIGFYITTKKIPQADAALQQFLTRFDTHTDLPGAVYNIALQCEQIGENDRALGLHEHDVAQFPDNAYAMRSQTRIVKIHAGDGDDTAADAAFDKLLTVFSKQPTLSEEIHYVARKYEDLKRYDKAIEVYRYNVQHFASNPYTVHSQVRIVWSYIRDGNDAAANTAFDRLLTLYPHEPTLCKEVFKVAEKFGESGKSERAREVYQYLIDTWSADGAILARQHVAMAHICLGDDAPVKAAVDDLMANFKDDPATPKAILGIGEQYLKQAMVERRRGAQDPPSAYFGKALASAKVVFERFPDASPAPEACLMAAQCYAALKDYDKSIEYHQILADRYPDYPVSRSVPSIIRMLIKNRDNPPSRDALGSWQAFLASKVPTTPVQDNSEKGGRQ